MAKPNTKTKPEPEPDLPPLRQPLMDAFAKVAAIEAELEANEREQAEARAKIREAEKTIQETAERVGVAHPDERRKLRKALEEAKESLADWREHLERLCRQHGNHQGLNAIDRQATMQAHLESARGDIAFARGALLKGHPVTLAIFAKVHELRAALFQATADALAIHNAGGVPPGEENWQSISADRPAPNPALVAWIAALATDAGAEFSE